MDLYDIPTSAVLHRGQVFWESIYGKVAKRVMGQMDRSGTEDLGLVARLMYGYLLSGTNILTQAETSFVLIAALIPQDVSPTVLCSGSFVCLFNCPWFPVAFCMDLGPCWTRSRSGPWS